MKKEPLSQEDVVPNHIYQDNKGNELLYLGKANFWNSSEYYDDCIRYIYIKKNILDKYDKHLPLSDILLDCRKKGFHHFAFSIKPRKMIKELGKDNRDIIKGHISSGVYNFNFV